MQEREFFKIKVQGAGSQRLNAAFKRLDNKWDDKTMSYSRLWEHTRYEGPFTMSSINAKRLSFKIWIVRRCMTQFEKSGGSDALAERFLTDALKRMDSKKEIQLWERHAFRTAEFNAYAKRNKNALSTTTIDISMFFLLARSLMDTSTVVTVSDDHLLRAAVSHDPVYDALVRGTNPEIMWRTIDWALRNRDFQLCLPTNRESFAFSDLRRWIEPRFSFDENDVVKSFRTIDVLSCVRRPSLVAAFTSKDVVDYVSRHTEESKRAEYPTPLMIAAELDGTLTGRIAMRAACLYNGRPTASEEFCAPFKIATAIRNDETMPGILRRYFSTGRFLVPGVLFTCLLWMHVVQGDDVAWYVPGEKTVHARLKRFEYDAHVFDSLFHSDFPVNDRDAIVRLLCAVAPFSYEFKVWGGIQTAVDGIVNSETRTILTSFTRLKKVHARYVDLVAFSGSILPNDVVRKIAEYDSDTPEWIKVCAVQDPRKRCEAFVDSLTRFFR